MTVNDDPFENVRAYWSDVKSYPVDELSAAGKRALYEQIRQLSIDCGPEEDISVTEKFLAEWQQALVAALIQEPHFWAYCLDIAVGLFSATPPKVSLKKDWIVGVHLRGFYDVYGAFVDGYADCLKDLEAGVVSEAQRQVSSLLREAEMQSEQTLQSAPVQLGTLDPNMISLFQLVMQEKAENSSRNRLTKNISSFGRLLEQLPTTAALLDKYEDRARLKNTTELDKFGSIVTNLLLLQISLPKMTALPPLTQEELDLLGKANSIDVVEGETEKIKRKRGTYEKKTYSAAEITGGDSNVLADPPLQIEWLQDYFSAQPDAITSPCWTSPNIIFDLEHQPLGALDEMPGFRATRGMEAQHEMEKSEDGQSETAEDLLKTIWRRTSSFAKGRTISEKELNDTVPTPEALHHACLQITKDSLANMNKDVFGKLCEKLTTAVEREERAAEVTGKWRFHDYTEMCFYDNWYHVRKLVQALGVWMVDERSQKALAFLELQMAVILAAVQGASDNPLPWILALDYVVQAIWRCCITWKQTLVFQDAPKPSNPVKTKGNSKGKGKAKVEEVLEEVEVSKEEVKVPETDADKWTHVKNVFEELAAFAQGTAIYGSVRRFGNLKLYRDGAAGDAGQLTSGTRLLDWYRLLYSYNPRCANLECNRLLKAPDKFHHIAGVKEIFSVASRDVRAGKRAVRQFISNNREECYPCFFSCLATRAPSPMLVVIFFHYSHLFHPTAEGCKGSRGKRGIVGIA